MEAINGVGDSLTGLLTVLCVAGFKPVEAAILAARANRWMGYYGNPYPATQIADLINKIPQALTKVLKNNKKDNINNRDQHKTIDRSSRPKRGDSN